MEYICNDCPRQCGALRNDIKGSGFCGCAVLPTVVRAAPHFGEEPCISGVNGSGAVFFTGCNLRCVFCQNREISRGKSGGKALTVSELRDTMLRLRDTGVHNINLVTPTHFVRVIRDALDGLELGIPVVWNSSGYESVESLRMLEGLVQVYMPDYKYAQSDLAAKYSYASDYPTVALEAVKEMFRQTGAYKLDGDGIMTSGVLIRHLILPECEENSMEVIDRISDTFPENSVLFSLMSQYTPMPGLERFPELQKRIDPAVSRNLYRYMVNCGLTDGYWQDVCSATDEMIPQFDGTGV
ncbi:MAG: radical SAM protein [Eubacteriales bacterium]|nr:radical SAM protein [Eubacteriales bacterium]